MEGIFQHWERGLEPCLFILHIEYPYPTLARLAEFLESRAIKTEQLQLFMHRQHAQVLLYCWLERDRTSRTRQLLNTVKGVRLLEVMDGKREIKRKL